MARSDLFAAAAVRFMTVFSDPAHYGLIKNVLCSFQMKLLRQVFNGNEFFDRFPRSLGLVVGVIACGARGPRFSSNHSKLSFLIRYKVSRKNWEHAKLNCLVSAS